MLINVENMNDIKVEILLKDLIDLQENAKLYFSAAKERDNYFEEIMKLREKVKELEEKGDKDGVQ